MIDPASAHEGDDRFFFFSFGDMDDVVQGPQFAKDIAVSAKFAVTTLHAALPFLTSGGSVTFVSSVSAGDSIAATAGLAATNGALEAMVPVLAIELAPTRVSAVAPEIIGTLWWAGVPEAVRSQTFAESARSAPVGRVGQATEVAGTIRFLVENGCVSGETLKADGGYRRA